MKIRILKEFRDPELEIITEAVENIIPPSMSIIIKQIKDKLPEKADQDVFAKYVVDYYPVSQGTGRAFNVETLSRIFFTMVGDLKFSLENSAYYRDWMLKQKELGKSPFGPLEEKERIEEVLNEFKEQFEGGYITKLNDEGMRDMYKSASMTWADKYSEYIMPPTVRAGVQHNAPTDPARALLTLAQAYKAFSKMCKKFFKKNPEFQKYNIQETFFIRLQDRWARMQGQWWSQRWARTSSSKIVSFLNADKNNHNKANAILSTHERFSVEGEFDSSKVHLLNYITNWTMSQEMQECDGSLDKPCVIKNFSNGKFWFNRATAVCNLSGDKMANCGTSRFDDSILILLKSGDLKSKVNWHTMLEWNPRRNSIVQVLGFGNSFPDREDWEEIKWLYEHFGKPRIEEAAWRHLEEKGRVKRKSIEEFYDFLGHEVSALKKSPKDWTELVRRLRAGAYNHETEEGGGQSGYRQTTRFARIRLERLAKKGDGFLDFEFIVRAPFRFSRIPQEHLVLYKKATQEYADDEAKNELTEFIKDGIRRGHEQIEDSGNLEYGLEFNKVNIRIMREPGDVKVALMRFIYKLNASAWSTGGEKLDVMAPRVHEIIVGIRNEVNHILLMQTGEGIVQNAEAYALQAIERMNQEGGLPKLPKPSVYFDKNRIERWMGNTRGKIARANRRWWTLVDELTKISSDDLSSPSKDVIDSIYEAATIYDNFERYLPDRIKQKWEIMTSEWKNDGESGERDHNQEIDNLFPDEDENVDDVTWADLAGDEDQPPQFQNAGEQFLDDFEMQGDDEDENLQEARNIVKKILAKEKYRGLRVRITEDKKVKKILAAGIIPYRGEGEDIEFLIGQSPQGWWDIFKGKIDPGETAEEAARREYEEESSFSYKGPLEANMTLQHEAVKAWLVEMPDQDAADFDVSKVSIIHTAERDEKLNRKNPYEGKPEVVAVGWFKKDEAESKVNRRQRPFIGMAYDKLNKKSLDESKGVTKLRIFDFDETIAFTSASTYVETPHREELEFPDQESFDNWVKKTAAHHKIKSFDPVPELEKLGYTVDFSEYAKVSNPQINKKVVSHLKRIINKNSDGSRGVYIMTARAGDSKDAIAQYLKAQGFDLGSFTDILTLAGSSKKDAIADLIKQHPNVNSIAFWDDSDRNISDVQQLRDMYPDMDIQINHVVDGSPKPVEEGKLEEGVGVIGWHVSNARNKESIIKNGIKSSMGSTDDLNPDYGEGRVYFFSHGQMDEGLHSAKMAMLEGAVVAAEPPYIAVPFNLKKTPGEIHRDPELSSSDIYARDGYYLIGSVPPEAVIGSFIKHEEELFKPTEDDLKEGKIRVYINKR